MSESPESIIIKGKEIGIWTVWRNLEKTLELNIFEIEKLANTEEGIAKIIQALSKSHIDYSMTGFIIRLIIVAENDELAKKYLLDNEKIFNIIKGTSQLYPNIRKVFSNIKEDELKEKLLFKYFFTIMEDDWKYGKSPLYGAQEDLIKIIFSFKSQETIRRLFENKDISLTLNYNLSEGQSKCISEIIHKETDAEKVKCIVPEVLKFLEPDQRKEIIISIESDEIKKEYISNEEIAEFFTPKLAYIKASYKSNELKKEAIEEGVKNNTLSGTDLAIIISSIKGDAKKTEYRKDKRISSKFDDLIYDESMIIASYDEKESDKIKYDFIKALIENLKKTNAYELSKKEILARIYHEQVTKIICSMTDSMKKRCLEDEEITKLLTYTDICVIVTSYENDEEKYRFVENNIEKINKIGNDWLKSIVLSMKAKYKKKCLENDKIIKRLQQNQKNRKGLNIYNIILSNYEYDFENYAYEGEKRISQISKEELEEERQAEDELKKEFLCTKGSRLKDYILCSIIDSINNPRLKLKLLNRFKRKLDYDDYHDSFERIEDELKEDLEEYGDEQKSEGYARK